MSIVIRNTSTLKKKMGNWYSNEAKENEADEKTDGRKKKTGPTSKKKPLPVDPVISQTLADLKKVDWSQIEKYPNPEQRFTVLINPNKREVYDGDTVTISYFIYGDNKKEKVPARHSIRLLGIDAPEITLRGKTTQLEKDAGLKVRDYVIQLIREAKVIECEVEKNDKYGGRLLGRIYLDGQDLSELLLDEKLVVFYDGKGRHEWQPRELKSIINKLNKLGI